LATAALVAMTLVATPWAGMAPIAVAQQDADDAMAGATGESGTVNGVPRETTDAAPVAPTGPGAPLTPGEVMLPPSVPAVPGLPVGTAPGVDPAIAGGITSTSEVVFSAVSDTTVFTSAPDSPQSAESAGLLALGGPEGAVTLISFDVSGIRGATVLSALLTFTGAGDSGGPGGGVGIIYDFVAQDGLTANGMPRSDSAVNIHGAPAWFEAVEPGGVSAVDVTGSISGNGAVTFVLPGQADATSTLLAIESGVPAELVLTVAQPA
jgi:hypothetical protein